MGHRIELSLADAIKNTPVHKKVDELLQGLYCFYHYSPLNRANLHKSADALGRKCLIPTRIGGTRWMAHTLKALDNFLCGYPVLLQHISQVISLIQYLPIDILMHFGRLT